MPKKINQFLVKNLGLNEPNKQSQVQTAPLTDKTPSKQLKSTSSGHSLFKQKEVPKKKIVTSVNLDDYILESMKEIAKKHDISLSEAIGTILKDFLNIK